MKRVDKASTAANHITDTTLLSALDGELSVTEAIKVRSHIEACWSCRVRMGKIERAIGDVTECRSAVVKPYLPLPNGPRAKFRARLEELVLAAKRKPFWQRLIERLKPITASPLSVHAVWALALLLVVLGVCLVRMGLSPTVAASELLERAKISEERSLRSVSHAVVYQKLRIRTRGKTITRTTYRDVPLGRNADTTNASPETLKDIQQRLQAVHFSWQEPLSVPAFISWRHSLREETDEIRRSSNGLLTLHTNPGEGVLSEVNLTLRESDYHPIAETLRFQDRNDIEISELAFKVMALEAIDPAIFGPSPTAPLIPLPLPIPPGPSMRELADAEVQARMVLHGVGADLGEQIDITEAPGKAVIVSGLVETPERKQELLRALQGIPYLRTSLSTVDEATATGPATEVQDNLLIVAVESAPPLQHKLEDLFSDEPERAEFVNQVLSKSQAAMNKAWAIRRLSERYTGDSPSKLDAQAQRDLETLIRDDVQSLQQAVNSLAESLTPLLSDVADEQSAASAAWQPCDTHSTAWHRDVDRAFSDTQSIHQDVSVLIAASSRENVEAEDVERELKLALARMARQLPALSRQMEGKFLTAADFDGGIHDKGAQNENDHGGCTPPDLCGDRVCADEYNGSDFWPSDR